MQRDWFDDYFDGFGKVQHLYIPPDEPAMGRGYRSRAMFEAAADFEMQRRMEYEIYLTQAYSGDSDNVITIGAPIANSLIYTPSTQSITYTTLSNYQGTSNALTLARFQTVPFASVGSIILNSTPQVTTITNLSSYTSLSSIDVSNQSRSTANNVLSSMPASVIQLNAKNCSLVYNDINTGTALTKLSGQIQTLDISNNAFTGNIVYSNSNRILSLTLSGNSITLGSFTSQNNLNLTTLNLRGTNSNNIFIRNNSKLNTLSLSGFTTGGIYCSNNALTALDLSNVTQYGILSCNQNSISALDLSRYTGNGGTIDCSSNKIRSLNFNDTGTWDNIYCQSNSLTSINLLSARMGSGLTYVDL